MRPQRKVLSYLTRRSRTLEFGIAVGEDRVHVHDFHATILHLLGLDHEQLTFRHAGRSDTEMERVL